MDALILAAGLGSRLREVEPCKPLTRLHGLSLIEIAIRQLAAVGVTRVVVSTGYLAEVIEAEMPGMAERTGVAVEARRVANYREPNGYSVMVGAADYTGEFLLVMADHIFSADVLKPLVEAPASSDGALLAVDRRITSPLVDPEDATWVETDEAGRIVRIGKTISTYDAVDCGAFRATPALPAAIRAAIEDGRPGSLSDGMQRLADEGRAGTIDIGEGWWIDVDDARALELAKTQLPGHLAELFVQTGTVQ